jgi:hypothetical protein
MKKTIDAFRNLTGSDLFCLSVYSLFISFFLIHEASKIVGFDLVDPSSLFISEATAWGVDVSARVKWMYRFLIACSVLIVLFFCLLKRAFRNSNERSVKHEDLLLLSISGSILCVMRIFGTDSTHVLSSLFFLFAFKLILVVLSENKVRVPKYLLQDGVLNLSASFGFLLMFATVFLFGTSNVVHKNYSTIFILATLIILGYYYLMHITYTSPRKATSFLLPLVAIPIVALISVELFFYKKLVSHRIINYQESFVYLFIFSIAAVLTLVFLTRKKRNSSSIQYKRYILPSLLVCNVIICSYEPVIDHNPDLFEPANILLSIQRVFEFHQIPVLDFMSSHMASEQWYGYVYSFIFGFDHGQSALAYGFLNSFIFIYVLYKFLVQVFKRETYALVFIFFFPFVSEVFFTTALVALLPLFQIQRLFEQTSPKRVFILILTCVGLILWRIDTGVIALFGTLVFLPILYFVYPKKIPLNIIGKGLTYFLAFGAVAFGIACILRGPQKLVDSLQHFYHYTAGSQGHGHKSLLTADVHQFYLYHILYPLVAVIMCLYIIYLLKTKYKDEIFSKAFVLVASLFTFILYIVHLQRGLVRHGFAELNDDYIISVFHISVALFIAFQLSQTSSIQRYGTFYVSTFLLFLMIKYFPFQVTKIPLENGITGARFYNIERPFDDPTLNGRVRMDTTFAKGNYAELNVFMNKHLDKDQTFYDFSNTSMLYYYCNRKMPSYFNQIPISDIDEFLQSKTVKQLDPEKVPIVIYSSCPKNANDAFDLIPNVMRHSTIAEYIYKNYMPLGVMDHKTLWATPKMIHKINNLLHPDPDTYVPQTYDYKFAAEYIGKYYSGTHADELEVAYQAPMAETVPNTDMLTFDLPEGLKRPTHAFLSLNFSQKEHDIKPYTIVVELLNERKDIVGTFTFERRDKFSSTYMLRLSNHYLWHIQKVSAIRMTNDKDLVSFEILKLK